jgi:hypothetical protein
MALGLARAGASVIVHWRMLTARSSRELDERIRAKWGDMLANA